ncbi:hypothetical protein [Ferrimonas gelatinilytica]|uniref:Uncharacterized protein n=1 Tax=Ferrimonas gelatinilytica TaxID=1255257 RepID=A0ABP9RX82_9GAMM
MIFAVFAFCGIVSLLACCTFTLITLHRQWELLEIFLGIIVTAATVGGSSLAWLWHHLLA